VTAPGVPGGKRWAGGDGARYDARFAELAAAGVDVHGEARLCAALVPAPARVLDAGCGTGRVARRLAELGFVCVGVDSDPSMLGQGTSSASPVVWLDADLARLPLADPALAEPFDLVVAAGNVVPLLAAGTEQAVVAALASRLAPAGLLVAGFGLDRAHLPLEQATVTLADYDGWCAAAGLRLQQRLAGWDGAGYDGGGYAVSVHRRLAG
jgi:SAM-dependent methyltransferase